MISISHSFLCFFVLFLSVEVDSNDITLHKDGDFMIAALLPITRANGNLIETYAIASEVVKLTIDKINNDTSLLEGVKLGYEIFNDKLNLSLIMKRVLGIVSKYRENSICRENEEFCTADSNNGPFRDKRIGAVIGPVTSANSVPTASLLGLYNIPQIGFSASSSILSDKSRFKSFLRTIPSDKYQAEAMASFVKKFEWNYVFFIGSDDEYGRQGLASFKMAARKIKVCTSEDVNIPFQRETDAAKQIKEMVEKMKKQPRIRVAVLFMFEQQASQVLKEAEKQGLRNMTWILSDAIGPSIINNGINPHLLHGAFGIDFVYSKIPQLEEHLSSITVEEAAKNPWMLKLMEKRLNCSTRLIAGKRACGKDEKLDKTAINLTSQWSGFISIINSINAVAYGLNNLLNRSRNVNGTLTAHPKVLYSYIHNATFTGPLGEQVSFDKSGDLATKKYTFLNVLLNRKGDTLDFKRVATWSSLQPASPKFFKNGQGHGLTWNNGKIPSATCSRVCKPGEKQVGKSDCCWACQKCPKGEISNSSGSTECIKCLQGWYANDAQTQCLKTSIDYVESSDAFSIVVISISSICLVAMMMIASLFYYFKATPLISDSNPVFLALLLLSMILGFICSIFQVSLYRTNAACRFLHGFLLLMLLLLASTLLAKTKTCDSYLRKYASHYIQPVVEYASLILIGALLLFQLLLMGIWFLTDTPVVRYLQSSQALHIRECHASWTAGRFIATGFPLAVLFLATAFAFKERDERKNHHEAKYVSFCTISICILLIAFFPTYRFAQGMTRSIVIATTSMVGALAVAGCIILPKVYILVVQPERNVPEEERERSHNTASSAHTAGSQHQPVFPDSDYDRRAANDVEFMTSSASSAHEPSPHDKDVLKDVPIT